MAKQNKKISALIVPVLLVAVLLVGATIAYLSAKSTITNHFVVGSFNLPTTDPTTGNAKQLDKYLDEPSWDDSVNHKLLPGVTFAKDPYVGIGAGSEDAAVYVYVENNFSNKIYFTINNGWAAVSGETTAGSIAGSYTSGLFKYTNGLTASANSDSWTTTPLFSTINVSDSATDADFTVGTGQDTTIEVSSFIHQAKDSSGNPISASTIEAAAKSAFGL